LIKFLSARCQKRRLRDLKLINGRSKGFVSSWG
jgi:hypothetical protein